ncbi:MAG: STAS domain-containing protein [Candidatus Margulisbacteria bacterium]|nr:STAS domain-containing protein [Candidatus Margulisiibacteriota bacterium]
MVLDLNVSMREKNNIPIIDLEGEIDVYTYPKLSDALKIIFEKYPSTKDLIINLGNVRYIDSTGLGVIANGASQISKISNGYVTIINATPQIRKIFDVSGLISTNFNLYDNEDTALNQINSKNS